MCPLKTAFSWVFGTFGDCDHSDDLEDGEDGKDAGDVDQDQDEGGGGDKKADDGADNNCILVNTMARTALGESRMAEIYQDIGAIQGLIRVSRNNLHSMMK